MANLVAVDLDAWHEAVIAAIRAAYPQFVTVEAYSEQREELEIPACLIDLEDLEAAPGDDPGTGQLAMVARWRARVVLGYRTEDVQRQIRKAATGVAQAIHLTRFGQLSVGPARVTVVAPDPFDPALDQFEVWAIEWEQSCYIGSPVDVLDAADDPYPYPEFEAVPERVFLGVVPKVGPEHVDDYEEVPS